MRFFAFLALLLPACVAADDITVGLLDDKLPYSDFNLWQRPVGALPELLETMETHGALHFSLQPAESIEQLTQQLHEHKVAMVLPPPLAVPPDGILISNPLLSQHWAIITRNNHLPLRHSSRLNLNQQRIVLLQNSPVRSSLASAWPDVTIEEAPTLSEALKLLHAGAADGIVCDAALADMLVHNLYPGQLSSESLPGIRSIQTLWFAPGEEALRQRVNQAIDNLPPGVTASIVTRWLLSASLDDIHPGTSTDRELFNALVVISCILSLFLSAFLLSEILRRRRAERGLLDALTYWQTLLNSIPTPLLVCNPLGEITHCNQALLKSLQLTSNQVVGTSLETVMARNPISPVVNHHEWVAALSSMAPQFSDRSIVIQGEEKEIVQWLAVYSDSRLIPQGVLLGWYDISERKRLERELAKALQQATDVSREKSDFLARMSHEIRSPMNAILGVLELEGGGDKPADSTLNIAYVASRQLLQIVGDVLDLSKIEAGEMQLQIQNCALYSMLEQVIETYTTLAEQKGLRLDSDIESVWRHYYSLDGAKLTQILNNLLSNAIKYTDRGYVSLQVTVTSGEGGKDTLAFRVEDSGIGIAADKQEKILQPYIQLDHASPASTGLGLPICTQLLKLMGSSLNIHSVEGKGSCFAFSLLLDSIAELPVAGGTTAGSDVEGALRLLVVDDQRANLSVMKLQLETLGHQVVTCNDGREAEQLLLSQSFDIVLTDCQMPVMNGYQLTETVRAREKNEGGYQVIIGCTANAFTDEQRRCLEAGMDGVLIKPVTLQDLRALFAEQQPVRLCMTEITAMAGQQSHIVVSVLDELQRSAERDRQQILELRIEEPDKLAQVLHRQKGSFALAGFQAGVTLSQQMEQALQICDEPALRIFRLQLNALSLRFITLLELERGRVHKE
ncbi:response regulator [Serratia ficaria]|uniref:response regulator n=1 Tax=Serratia ficaria TaxID=61651 RepID=UPI00217C7465|nr:response regulator [Serratia ficaria]CAI2092422.1 Virulence sensor protein BvgS precursor [Serratia ficaria]